MVNPIWQHLSNIRGHFKCDLSHMWKCKADWPNVFLFLVFYGHIRPHYFSSRDERMQFYFCRLTYRAYYRNSCNSTSRVLFIYNSLWYTWYTWWYTCLICIYISTWWRHQMEIFSVLLALCAGNSPVPVNSPHKGQWHGALMFSLICVWINGWVNNRKAGDLRCHRGHYDVKVMKLKLTNELITLYGYQHSVSKYCGNLES